MCDLAETYHIYDYRSMPARFVATLAAGLSEDSRVRRKASGMKPVSQTLMLALIIDEIASECGGKAFMVDTLTVGETETKGDAQSFETIEDFKAARQKLLEAINGS